MEKWIENNYLFIFIASFIVGLVVVFISVPMLSMYLFDDLDSRLIFTFAIAMSLWVGMLFYFRKTTDKAFSLQAIQNGVLVSAMVMLVTLSIAVPIN